MINHAQEMVTAKRRAEQAEAAASCASGVPANVLSAASSLFLQHHGRPPASTAESLAFAQVTL